MQRGIRTALLFVALVAAHYFLRPLLGWRVSMDFLVIAVLLVAVRVRPGVAALIGFTLGLIGDSLAPATFGAGALAMSIVGFSASWLKAVFFSDNVFLHAFFFFVGKWAFDVLFVVAGRQGGVYDMATQMVLWSPLAAALTAVTGVLVLLLFRGMLEAPSS
ncbi:MAG: rod shape-determining protein MreD [Gemmatimonadetes bacterium]|jgi:rod shape-determining protein MreD|nr:rod shape-determining protein MreD [Gemmatimonadota bacterium]MCC7322467.1 rod shape-determining protein MreD [Gemmatimonadaceae bacterium]MBK7835596.1 rod shape-determining protein MreD [Gemmatimonadota bacterium]MBK8061989.1 rod shape-determining protein MreD [Gemmatimonadota bacterium]MBK8645644.1 rod shape-determining protein MreD [Gemmatimonadota bacterium]